MLNTIDLDFFKKKHRSIEYTNGKTFYVYGLEDSKKLRFQFSPNSSIDTMQFQSKSQQDFL